MICQRHLWDARSYAWSLVFLFFGPFVLSSSLVHFKKWSRVPYEGHSLWQGSWYRVLSRVVFWFFWDTLFLIFSCISCYLMVSASNICRFPFLQASGRGSKFSLGSWVRETSEEGQRIHRPKFSEYNNKEEDNSPKTLNDKNLLASSQKDSYYRSLIIWDSSLHPPPVLLLLLFNSK